MGKRFAATERWDDPWYRKLSNDYKSFWDYLCAKCDSIGLWKVDFEMANFCLNNKIEKDEALKFLNDGKERIKIIDNGSVWMIVDFIQFQYGCLSENNSFHRSIISKLEKLGVSKGCPRGVLGHKEKEEEEVKDKDKEGVVGETFPPTVGMVFEYCQSRKNSIDPERFVDHYQSNGWMRGKAKIKDWRACVRTWEQSSVKPRELKQSFGIGA